MKRPILYITIAFALGIALSSFFSVPIAYSIILSAIFIALACILSRKDIPSHVSLYLAVLFFGIAYYTNSCIIPLDHISRITADNPKHVYIRGVVTDDPVIEMNFYNQNKAVFLLKAEAFAEEGFGKRRAGMSKSSLILMPVISFSAMR